MMEVLQSSKVAPNGHSTRACRISLGLKTMERMGLQFGDFVLVVVDDNGRFLLQKAEARPDD
jgi:hypothetical protein